MTDLSRDDERRVRDVHRLGTDDVVGKARHQVDDVSLVRVATTTHREDGFAFQHI